MAETKLNTMELLAAVIHVAFLVGGLYLILSLNASNFDATETTSLIWFTLVAVADRVLAVGVLRRLGS